MLTSTLLKSPGAALGPVMMIRPRFFCSLSPITKKSKSLSTSINISRCLSGFTSTKTVTPSGGMPPNQLICKTIFDQMLPNTQQLVVGLIKKNRTSLAKIITLIESSRGDHKEQSRLILDYILYYNKAHLSMSAVDLYSHHSSTSRHKNCTMNTYETPKGSEGLHGFCAGGPTFRIGFAGPPGAGKSTFIDRFSRFLMERTNGTGLITADTTGSNDTKAALMQPSDMYHNIAVIPVDPSSHFSGGSILGDKTRMEYLSKLPSRPFVDTDIDYSNPEYYFPTSVVPEGNNCDSPTGDGRGAGGTAYVRAAPTRGILGGVAEYTCDIITLCESSGVDTVLIESVGVGQNEVELDQVIDCFVLIVNPGGGDDLQASKKGIMEAADIVLVNKADGELMPLARHTKADYAGSIKFMRTKPSIIQSNWKREVALVSARTGLGCEQFYELLLKYYDTMNSTSTSVDLSTNAVKTGTTADLSVSGKTKNDGTSAGTDADIHLTSVFRHKRALQANYWMWQQFTRQLVTILTYNYKHGHSYEDTSSSTAPVDNIVPGFEYSSNATLSAKVSAAAKELEKRIYKDEISSRAAGSYLLKVALESR